MLGHVLYVKAMRGGMIPIAYVYPARMRATRDLLRRWMPLMRKRAELLSHIQNTASQYNVPAFEKRIAYGFHRAGLPDHFDHPVVRKSVEVDLALIEHYDQLPKEACPPVVNGATMTVRR